MTTSEAAFAKINLYLDVVGRRDDGFHDILSVMHSVSLADTIIISSQAADTTDITITTNILELPVDESNIVHRAVKSYLSYFNIHARVNVRIDKIIPIGAGLGGGSSNAAAALRAMNRIYKKADLDQLLSLASDLGSDVPFCLIGGLAVCTGRGERVASLFKAEPMNFVVSIGKSRVSTPKAYADLDLIYDNFNKPTQSAETPYKKAIENLKNGCFDVPAYNIFEQVVCLDEIATIKEIMTKNGAEYTLMSGSGPSVFGKFADVSKATDACNALISKGYTAFACYSVYPEVNL